MTHTTFEHGRLNGTIYDSQRYSRVGSVVFSKTKERYGGFSNMCGGYPLKVNGIEFRTSESLYQSCRYPDYPEVQRYVIDQTSPMMSKRVPNRSELTRKDWDEVRVEVMRWCLRVKLSQHLDEFGGLLWITEKRPIVEESKKDDFWGSKPIEDGSLVGSNVLGEVVDGTPGRVQDRGSEPVENGSTAVDSELPVDGGGDWGGGVTA